MPWLDPRTADYYRSTLFNQIEHSVLPPITTDINPDCDDALTAEECRYVLVDIDTITAAIDAHKKNPDDRIAVLNFASFKNPGGAFLRNALAQEEYLCYCANLYNELEKHNYDWYQPHQQCLHNGLYENQSLLSHNVTVLASKPGALLPNEEQFQIDVLTCAAPNWTPALRYNTVSQEKLVEATRDRIKYVMRIFSKNNYDNVIVGAYGCGVFKNDPKTVVLAFLKAMGMYKLNHVTFAVPDKNSYNYKAFARELVGNDNHTT